MKKLIISTVTAVAVIVGFPAAAFAHVVVTPNRAGIGASTKFNVSVPNEKEVAVTSVELSVPKGVQNVQPDVLAGWDIAISHDGSGNVTFITWTGTIPVGQREDFAFKAQTPADAGALDWKASQTYADGTVVHWDQNPTTGKAIKNNAGPYSVTKVVNDLNANKSGAADGFGASTTAKLALALSIAALILGVGSLFLGRRKR